MRDRRRKLTPAEKEFLRAEIQQDVRALEAYEERHGSFAAFVRDHYRRRRAKG
jgi:hypothetical protein